MPVERTGIGNDNIDETDGTIITSKDLNTRTTLTLVPSAATDGLTVENITIDNLTSMDLGQQLSSNDVNVLEKLQADLDQLKNSAGGGGIAGAASHLPAENVVMIINTATSTGTGAASSRAVVVEPLHPESIVTIQPTTQQTLLSGHNNKGVAAAAKRSLVNSASSSPGPVVTKVIITKNPTTNQPQVVPVSSLGQLHGQPGVTMATLAPGMTIIPQVQHGAQTPTKTITISSQGIVPAGKQILTTLPGTPTKIINKIPISPAKTPTKITMIPVSLAKSPQRAAIAPASSIMVARTLGAGASSIAGTSLVASTAQMKPATITMSPTKVIFKHANQQTGKSLPLTLSSGQPVISQAALSQMSLASSCVSGGVQQISVPGSKFHYVRLVTPSSQPNTSATGLKSLPAGSHVLQVKPIAPATLSSTSTVLSGSSALSQVKITLPVQSTQPMAPKLATAQGSGTVPQRILLPAPNQVSIRPVASTTGTSVTQIRPQLSGGAAGGFSQLPQGATIISTGNIPGVQGFALVPAHYVSQLRPQINKPGQSSVQLQPQLQQNVRSEFIPIASSDPMVTASTLARNTTNGTTIEATGSRPRKPCNCTKSQCLKLYCDCFANGEFCHNCNCTNCANNLEHEEERSKAIKSCLDRNPMAFHPKIGKGRVGDGDRRHNKGCNCKRSGCLKNYCECYEAKIMCSSTCKCIGCKNFEESPERKTLMHLADAAEVRVQQQAAAKTKLSSQISDLPSRPPTTICGERLPYTFVTTEVAEATCACLLAQLEEADRLKMPAVIQERMVIEEFGRCLMQIIDSANKTKDVPLLPEALRQGKARVGSRILKRREIGDST